MRKGIRAFGVFVLLSALFTALLSWQLQAFIDMAQYDQSKGQILEGMATYWGTVVGAWTLAAVLVTAAFALIQLHEETTARNAQVILSIFERFDQDPQIMEIRGLVIQNQQELRCVACSLRVEEDPEGQKLRKAIEAIGHHSLNFHNLNHMLTRLEHVCFLLRKGFVSAELKIEFYYSIVRLWRILGNLIRYERKRRGLNGEFPWWLRQFILFAEEMESPTFRHQLERLSRKKPDIFGPLPNS